ncbi:DUF3533 domain-containing protein [Streptomyces sp. NPDC054784]
MRHSLLLAELRDAITPRAFLLMSGVLLVQLGFLLSYVGAFHHPEPRRVPLAVVAPQQVADRLDALPGGPVRSTVVRDEGEARARVMRRDADGAYVMDPDGRRDTLLVASGAGGSVTSAVTEIGRSLARDQDRTLRTVDIAPAGGQDNGSLTAFYLVVGWLVGGYLAAAMLGVTAGARPATVRRAVVRLLVSAVYAVVSGLGGAVIVGPVLGALPGHLPELWGIGTLVVFAACTLTIALQTLCGVFGIGLAIVLLVVLGNPSAGGAYQEHMIPGFWSAIGSWLPPGAGVSAVRNTVYFDAHALAGPLWTLAVWAAASAAVTLALAARHRPTEPPPLRGYPVLPA